MHVTSIRIESDPLASDKRRRLAEPDETWAAIRSEAVDEEMQPKAWLRGIDTITLFVEDLEAAKDFYGRVFGLPMVFGDKDSAVFKFGSTLVNLLKTAAAGELIEPAKIAAREAGSRAVFTIGVDDVDAVCAELAARGVTLLNGPMDRPWGVRTASFADPGGHIWEIAK